MFISVSHRVQAVQWDGTNNDEIKDLVGIENFNVSNGQTQIRVNDRSGIWQNLHPGFRVVRDVETGFSFVSSPDSFKYLFESE